MFVAVSAGVLGAAAMLLYLLGCEPAFFAEVDTLAPDERAARAKQFLRRSTAVCNQMTNDAEWDAVFDDVQVNAWLAEDFARKHSGLLPSGVSDPRVSFGAGRVAVAFRMSYGPMTTIVAVTGRLWLPKPNVVAFEVESVRAGRIPLPRSSMIATATAAVSSVGLDLDWKRNNDKPVALLHCPQLGGEKGFGVERLELRRGVLYVAGRSMTPAIDPRDDASVPVVSTKWPAATQTAPSRDGRAASVVSTAPNRQDQSPDSARVR
jgi:hypothetical protein